MADSFNPLSLISAPISGAFQYAGGKAQADAEKEASQLQNQFNEKALAAAQEQQQWQRGQYANYLSRLEPYNQMGLQSGTTLTGLLGRSPYAQYANTGQTPTPQRYSLPAESIGTLAAKLKG